MRAAILANLVCATTACREARAPQAPPTPLTTSPTVVRPPHWEHTHRGISWSQAELDLDDARDLFGTPTTGRRMVWSVVRLDLAHVALRAERAPHASLDDVAHDPTVAFAVDGGFFNPDLRPSGLLVTDRTALAPLTTGGGSGVLRIEGGRADVLAREVVADGGAAAAFAVQCGPRLVERGAVVGIHRDDGKRFARTAACVRDRGRTLDIVLAWDRDAPLLGPGLLRFAERLAGPSPVGDSAGCEVALNLDGGPSTGGFVRATPGHPGLSHDAIGPTPWLLTVRGATVAPP